MLALNAKKIHRAKGLLELDPEQEFVCPEESMGYAASIERLVFRKLRANGAKPAIIEFGSGTGEPVIAAIRNSGFTGVVHGYEVNPAVSEIADQLIEENGLSKHYIVHNISFFDSRRVPPADYLIANPPYIPCKDKDLLSLPYICGGPDGNSVSKQLLSLGYENVFLEVSSYSNPVELLHCAASQGYKITDFHFSYLPLGIYSRQEVVYQRLLEMRREGKAFLTESGYLVGSAFFTKTMNNEPDLTTMFLKSLTAI